MPLRQNSGDLDSTSCGSPLDQNSASTEDEVWFLTAVPVEHNRIKCSESNKGEDRVSAFSLLGSPSLFVTTSHGRSNFSVFVQEKLTRGPFSSRRSHYKII